MVSADNLKELKNRIIEKEIVERNVPFMLWIANFTKKADDVVMSDCASVANYLRWVWKNNIVEEPTEKNLRKDLAKLECRNIVKFSRVSSAKHIILTKKGKKVLKEVKK